MKTIQLNSGDHMPMMGLGTWQSTDAEIHQAIEVALKTGYRHFDCAAIYLNEAILGKAFQQQLTAQGLAREDIWVTSKLWNSFHAPEDVEPALKKTLSDLQMDYLDLYLIHWPVSFINEVGLSGFVLDDPAQMPRDYVNLQDTWAALEACVKKGLLKNIGLSNFSITDIEHIKQTANIMPAVNQIEAHAYLAQFDLVNACQQQGIQVTAYSPLGSPGMPEAYLRDDRPKTLLLQNDTILTIANNHDATPAQVLLAWLLERNMIVIPKSTNPKRIQENWNAQTVQLNDNDMENINKLNLDFRYVNPTSWETEGGWFTIEDLWR